MNRHQLERTRVLRGKILQAAAEAFRKKGYHATSIAEIARELGLSKPTVYHYFKNKQELLFESHMMSASTVVDDLRAIMNRSETAEVRLRQAILAFITAVVDKVPLSSVLVFQDTILSPAQRSKIIHVRDNADLIFRTILSQGMASGEFVRVDPKMVSLVILGAMNWLPHWFSRHGPLSVQDIGHRFADYLIRGIARETRARERMAAGSVDGGDERSGMSIAVLRGGERLGLAVALALGRSGSRVAVIDRLAWSAERAADAIIAAGGDATAFAADLADVGAFELAMDKLIAKTGQLDAVVDVHDLVNAPSLLNGDKGQPACPHTQATVAARVAERVFTREGRGTLIFVVRAVAPTGVDDDMEIDAQASCGWFTGFTRALARELAPSGIRVNTILARSVGDEQDARSSRALSDAVQVLLSARSHSLTGQVLRFEAATSPVR